jgi:GT2 family glycosyltransferase
MTIRQGRTDPETTVVIPTYGAGDHLVRVLHGLAAQQYRDFVALVVDNNERPKWVTRLHEERLDVDVISEPRNGLQNARNAGVRVARGLYVAFLDDDGIPTPHWLGNLVEGTKRYGAMASGGQVVPEFASEPPTWMGRAERALLSELIHLEDWPAIRDDMYIVGANMCIDRRAFKKLGQFDPHFDRTARSLLSSGELEFTRRLQSNGERVAFVASALVRHQIDPTRLTVRYFLSRAYWQGRSDALLEGRWGRPVAFGKRNWQLNIGALSSRAWSLVRCRTRDEKVVRALSLARECGYCQQFALLQGTRFRGRSAP